MCMIIIAIMIMMIVAISMVVKTWFIVVMVWLIGLLAHGSLHSGGWLGSNPGLAGLLAG